MNNKGDVRNVVGTCRGAGELHGFSDSPQAMPTQTEASGTKKLVTASAAGKIANFTVRGIIVSNA